MKCFVFALGLVVIAVAAFAQNAQDIEKGGVARELAETRNVEAKLAGTALDPQAETIKRLLKIQLPPNATEQQVREYITAIFLANRVENALSSGDALLVFMLVRVGPENLGVLISFLGVEGDADRSDCILPAIQILAGEKNKAQIIEALRVHKELADVIIRKGWVNDARNILIEGLRDKPRHLPREWVQAVALLKDPGTYDLLRWYLVNGDDPWSTYQSLKYMPEIGMSNAINELWVRARDEKDPMVVMPLAEMALDYGYLDALAKKVEILLQEPLPPRVHGEPPWRIKLSHTDFEGTPQEIAQWFQENKARLTFDKATKKFVVPAAN